MNSIHSFQHTTVISIPHANIMSQPCLPARFVFLSLKPYGRQSFWEHLSWFFLVLWILPFLWWLCHLIWWWWLPDEADFITMCFLLLCFDPSCSAFLLCPACFRCTHMYIHVLLLHDYDRLYFNNLIGALSKRSEDELSRMQKMERYMNERYWIVGYRYEVQDIQQSNRSTNTYDELAMTNVVVWANQHSQWNYNETNKTKYLNPARERRGNRRRRPVKMRCHDTTPNLQSAISSHHRKSNMLRWR